MLARSKAGNRVVCGRVLVLNITGVKHFFFVVNFFFFLQEVFSIYLSDQSGYHRPRPE